MKGYFNAEEVCKEESVELEYKNYLNEEVKGDDDDWFHQDPSRGMGNIIDGGIKGVKNFIFIWGCRPQTGVSAKTEMVNDIVGVLTKKRDRDTNTVELPSALDQLKGKDADFEMVCSNTI